MTGVQTCALPIFQRLLESIDLSFGITGRGATLGFSSKVLRRVGDEQSRRPVPHLGIVEGFWELFNFLVPVDDWTFETPKHRNRMMSERYREW